MAAIVSIAPGEDLLEAIARAARGGEDFVQASGSVDGVEIRVAAEGADPVRALRGRWTLANLIGPSGGPFGVTLARATDAGLEVVAGELVRARSAGVTAAVFAGDGAPRAAAAPSPVAPQPIASQPIAPAAAREPPRAPQQPQASQWAVSALATAASARAKQPPVEEQVWPVPGDLVQHFAFGLCEVLMAEDDKLKIRDIHGQGKIREIRLEMLAVTGPREKDGKRLFRLERRS